MRFGSRAIPAKLHRRTGAYARVRYQADDRTAAQFRARAAVLYGRSAKRSVGQLPVDLADHLFIQLHDLAVIGQNAVHFVFHVAHLRVDQRAKPLAEQVKDLFFMQRLYHNSPCMCGEISSQRGAPICHFAMMSAPDFNL